VSQQLLLSAAIIVGFIQPALASPIPRQAYITGGTSSGGRCTIEVTVDGSAEVEVTGSNGVLTTLAGQPASWRRFQCTTPLPRNPVDFRFAGIDGRGSIRLLRDPRSTGGSAVFQIRDPKGGRGTYTFDFTWRNNGGGAWPPGPAPQPPSPGHGPGPGGFPIAQAIRACQDSVTNRLNRDGYPYVTFERTIPDNNPGRHDWITGLVSGRRGFETTRFSFSCSVDSRSGMVRSVDVSRR